MSSYICNNIKFIIFPCSKNLVYHSKYNESKNFRVSWTLLELIKRDILYQSYIQYIYQSRTWKVLHNVNRRCEKLGSIIVFVWVDFQGHTKTSHYNVINFGWTRFVINERIRNTYCKVIALGITRTQMYFKKSVSLANA